MTSTTTRPAGRSLLRSRGAMLSTLAAVALGAGGIGAIVNVAESDPDGPAANALSGVVPTADPRGLSGEAWASAQAGSCLTWTINGDEVSSFSTVDCAEPHLFEVAGRIDFTAADEQEGDAAAPAPDGETDDAGAVTPEPGSPGGDGELTFPEGSPLPTEEQQYEIQREICEPMIEEFAPDHPIDPLGRFAPTVVPPSEEGWNAGDRTLLCGVTTNELDGRLTESVGHFATADQHRLWEPGTCLGFTEARLPGAPVDCSEPHAVEIVSELDVTEVLDAEGPVPMPETQSELTHEACRAAGVEYVGGEEELRQSTLLSILVTPISEISWDTGSRTVNCGLMIPDDEGQFDTLTGSPITGDLQIGGAEPVAPTTTEIPLPTEPMSPDSLPTPAEPTAAPGDTQVDTGTGFGQ